MQTIKGNYVSLGIGWILVKFHLSRKWELVFNQYITDLTDISFKNVLASIGQTSLTEIENGIN